MDDACLRLASFPGSWERGLLKTSLVPRLLAGNEASNLYCRLKSQRNGQCLPKTSLIPRLLAGNEASNLYCRLKSQRNGQCLPTHSQAPGNEASNLHCRLRSLRNGRCLLKTYYILLCKQWVIKRKLYYHVSSTK